MTGKMGRRSAPRKAPDEYFVQLPHGFLKEPAWKALKPGARILYIALKRYFNGQNNGRIFLSVRKAAEDTGMSKSAIESYFMELTDKGFIRTAKKGHLGIEGQGQATSWVLSEIGFKGMRATKEYQKWQSKKQNPVLKSKTGCPEIKDTKSNKCPEIQDRCPEIKDRKRPKTGGACPEIQDTCTLSTMGRAAKTNTCTATVIPFDPDKAASGLNRIKRLAHNIPP